MLDRHGLDIDIRYIIALFPHYRWCGNAKVRRTDDEMRERRDIAARSAAAWGGR